MKNISICANFSIMSRNVNFTLVITLMSIVSKAYVINYNDISSITKGVYNYHRAMGIPLAEKIKSYETEITMQRITGGLATDINAVPYQAGLIISVHEYLSVCGGSIISETNVLTAAHCYSDGTSTAQAVTVVLGSSLLFFGGTRIEAEDVIQHSEFNPITAENDIAVIRVPSVVFSSQIQPVALPPGEENMDFTGYQATASGYGMTSDGEEIMLLQTVNSVTVPVISNAECAAVYGSLILNQHLCTSGVDAKGTCGGDSGGPLVLDVDSKTILIGITSFGAEFCTESHPSAFVRVTEFLDWILAEMI